MSYTINKTDGTVLTEIVDGSIDQTITDITLIGKNSSSYGEFINENFVKILENFSNSSMPNNPIQGQLWYDTGEARLKVYDGSGFKVSGGAIVSPTIPTTIGQGDIWIDSKRQQLYFNDGVSTILAGPAYSSAQGVTGFSIADIVDVDGAVRTVIYLYVGEVPLGIFSKDTFKLGSELTGITGSTFQSLTTVYHTGSRVMYQEPSLPDQPAKPIRFYEAIKNLPTPTSLSPNPDPTDTAYWKELEIQTGFTVAESLAIKFDVLASKASALVDASGNLKTAEDFLFSDDPTPTLTGSLALVNSLPLILGPASNNEIFVDANSFELRALSANQNFYFKTKRNGALQNTLVLDSVNQRAGIFTDTPEATLDVNGDAVVQGNLTVKGDLTTISTTNLEIADKLIELGKTDNPSNSTAADAGILVSGGLDGDKTFTWTAVGVDGGWASSENLNLASGKEFRIDGVKVVDSSSLGDFIETSSLRQVGTLNFLNAANLRISDNTLSYHGVLSDGDVVIAPAGAGTVDVNNARISGLQDPQYSGDAVNMGYLNKTVRSAILGTALDTTGLTNSNIEVIITKIFPIAYHENNTVCRVYATDTQGVKVFYIDEVTGWTFDYDE